MKSLDLVAEQLRAIGFAPKIIQCGDFPARNAVAFDYHVITGPHKARQFRVAIGFQEDAFPEYPPHFIYVADLASARIPVHSSFRHDGAHWSAFSVPPSDFWDGLPSSHKNMKTYVNRHLARFWDQL